MTPYELKYAVEATGKNQHFFDREDYAILRRHDEELWVSPSGG